ncbi:MAG: MBL fold metallo-hydrolase [Anaerolineae bacterium]|nr:MBL fold metallo-hydrolase [Anaerolineae bacterium]
MPETTLMQISDHVYWLSPGKPDRPSLCAVVGTQRSLLLDAGASAAHIRLLLDSLASVGVSLPHYVALTHWHWDHVFGAAMLGLPMIAHTLTADQVNVLATYDWSDAALDQRVSSGEEIAFCADNIKLELPEPRRVQIITPDIIFQDSLEFRLGDVTCHLQHVGGDHAADSCVAYIAPDRVLFLGDCLYDAIYAPTRHYTTRQLFPLLDKLRAFDAEQYVEGHNPTVMTRAEFIAMTDKMRQAGTLVEQIGPDEAVVLAQLDQPVDEDTAYFVKAFIAGI